MWTFLKKDKQELKKRLIVYGLSIIRAKVFPGLEKLHNLHDDLVVSLTGRGLSCEIVMLAGPKPNVIKLT